MIGFQNCGSGQGASEGEGEASLQVDLTTQQASAYQHLLAGGAEQCGVTTLATRAVGAPFVGCYAAAHAISLLEQRLGGAPAPYLVDTHLRSPEI